MAEKHRLIQHISDTARWAALYRANETDRPDALFHDPFARRLAGERGREVAEALPFHRQNTWSWLTRTWLFGKTITERVNAGADVIVSLAAGLDTSPYRLELPHSLLWIEVDLPGILDYKEEMLGTAKPKCKLERVRLDLSDRPARAALFESIAARSKRATVISEGFLIYLTAEASGELSQELARYPAFHNWVLDLVSPGLLRTLKQNTDAQFAENVTPLQFAPENGPAFFAQHGWSVVEVRSLLKTAAHLNRLPSELRSFAAFPEDPEHAGERPWAGVCVLQNLLAS